ncbi:hypothetical protein Gohar_015999, partial [Gossypium harknessii]|nr:hypothetical protein [Gossypium harknessii]
VQGGGRSRDLGICFHNFSIRPILPRAPRICKWEKPPEGVIKVNVDASVNANRTGLGIIVRDSDGFILSGKAVFISKVVNSEWAKLDALLKGIRLAQSLNLDKVIFEMDCTCAVSRFCKHKDDITIFGYRIQEAHKILDSFSKFEVKWVDCRCNKVANSLCNWSLSNCCNLSFKMDYPSDIHNLVISKEECYILLSIKLGIFV